MNTLKKKERRQDIFLNQSFCKSNKSSKSNLKAPNSRVRSSYKVGLIEANKIGIVSIKRGRRLAIKIAKKSSSIEVARVAVKKYADHDQLFGDPDEYVSCYPD